MLLYNNYITTNVINKVHQSKYFLNRYKSTRKTSLALVDKRGFFVGAGDRT